MKHTISIPGKQRLMAYCSAAGVGAFAASQTASAEIIFTDLNSAPLTLGPTTAGYFNNTLTLDIDGGGTDLTFSVYNNPNINSYSIRVSPQANALSNGTAGGYSFNPILAFDQNDTIGSSNASAVASYGTGVGGQPFLSSGANNDFTSGSYLGVFLPSGNYAWVALEINTSFNGATNHHGLTITGHAYENDGSDILASAVPEPSTYAFGLGLLALGAAGTRRWRRQKAASTEDLAPEA